MRYRCLLGRRSGYTSQIQHKALPDHGVIRFSSIILFFPSSRSPLPDQGEPSNLSFGMRRQVLRAVVAAIPSAHRSSFLSTDRLKRFAQVDFQPQIKRYGAMQRVFGSLATALDRRREKA
jgi:hypothetical protein